MWPDPQETAGLVKFTEEILMKNWIFCAVFYILNDSIKIIITQFLD